MRGNIHIYFKNSGLKDFRGGPGVKNSPANPGDMGLIPAWGTKNRHAEGQLSLRTAAREGLPATARTQCSHNSNNDKRYVYLASKASWMLCIFHHNKKYELGGRSTHVFKQFSYLGKKKIDCEDRGNFLFGSKLEEGARERRERQRPDRRRGPGPRRGRGMRPVLGSRGTVKDVAVMGVGDGRSFFTSVSSNRMLPLPGD